MKTDITCVWGDVVVVEESQNRICVYTDTYDSGYIDLLDIIRWVKENMPNLEDETAYKQYMLDVQIKTCEERLAYLKNDSNFTGLPQYRDGNIKYAEDQLAELLNK